MPPHRRFPLLLGLLLLLMTVPSGVAAAASRGFADDFTAFDAGLWAAGDHVLGRSTIDPANVAVSEGRLELGLPGGTTDGAEVRTLSTFRYGSYRARIQVADAPSSITGFFLYAPPDYESEIDVELFNDPEGEVMFSTYARGAQTHTERRPLGFDPTAAMHEYRFDYGPGSVSFLVDGVPLRTWSTGVPSAAMNLYLNAWFPAWLAGTAPMERRATLVDSVEFRPR